MSAAKSVFKDRGYELADIYGSMFPALTIAQRDFLAGLVTGALERAIADPGRKVSDAFALGRIARAVGIPGSEYDGMTIPQLAQRVEGLLDVRDLDASNAGSEATCISLETAFTEIDERGEWSGRFGSSRMNALCERYRNLRAQIETLKGSSAEQAGEITRHVLAIRELQAERDTLRKAAQKS